MKLHSQSIVKWLFAFTLLSGCSKVKDEQPLPINKIPASVATLLSTTHPNAREINLKTIEENQEWEARFSEGTIQYCVALNPTEILATHKLISQTVPDTIQQYFETIPLLSPNKGVLSDYREILSPGSSDRNFTAKFTVDQKDYLLKFRTWTSQPKTDFDVNITSYHKFNYYELNDNITGYLVQNGYANVFVNTIVANDNKKKYHAWTNHTDGQQGNMVFDGQSQLIVSFKKTASNLRLIDLPEKAQKFIENTGLSFTDQNFKYAEKNVAGYHVLLVGIRGLYGYRYTLDFDNDGNVIEFQLNIVVAHNRK